MFAPALWGLYIFFHRLNSLHSNNNRHFYIELFLECFLFWTAFCGLLSYYINGSPNPHELALVYVLLSSLLFAGFAVSIEWMLHNLFVE